MSAPCPSIGVIRAQIRAIRSKDPDAKVFGIFAPGRWTGPTLQGDGGDEIAIYQCDSPLQMRLALQSAPATVSATVLMTPMDQAQVSDDILVRMALRKLHPINSWEIVRSLFAARLLDPRITRYPFIADLLLEHAGMRDYPPVAGGLLDADTVWGILLPERLGLPGAHPHTVELLACAAETEFAARWATRPTEFRDAAAEWIAGTGGAVADAVLCCAGGEHGPKALAIGLVMGVVYGEGVGHDLDKAAGRLESFVGSTNLPVEIARRWSDAASVAMGRLSKPALRRCLDDAEAILRSIGASEHAWRSDQLESGFEARLARLGNALAAYVDTRATAVPPEVHRLHASAREHRLGRSGGRRMERLDMAVRLARWLADQTAAGGRKPANLVDFAQKYAADGAYVDWARQVLRGGEPNKELAAAFVRVVDRVTELREVENQQFGRTLAEQRAMGDAGAGLIPVEQMLDRIVARAAEKEPVLLLLVDGMNWAVFRELLTDVKSQDWVDLSFDGSPRRLIGLAALPSVTEVCRTSLLCGSLRRGQAADETSGFAAHPRLLVVSQAGPAPKLFHKAALEGDEDTSLAGEIRAALANRKQRVVGIIINAVDDYLDKGDQIDAVWNTQHIRVLGPIFAEASAAGRLVILLSDHGHVLDRQTECREAADGVRWRRPGSASTKDEVEVSSPRVLLPDGGRVVVPWSERLRYGSKRNGYHGGATPQEMLIPIAVLWPKLDVPEGFGELAVDVPSWWTEPMAAPQVPVVVEPPRRPAKKTKTPTLFDLGQVPPAAAPAREPWIKSLLQSEIFVSQKRLAGRVRIDDATLEQFLSALAGRGGTITAAALAVAIEVPEHRLAGLLAVMQRLLNVEGYSILDRQDAAGTVVLNIPLLKKQFELES